jgi:ATP-binding cassette subfamily C protein CydD
MLAPEFYQPLRDMGTHYHAKAQAIGAAEELKALLDYQVIDQQVVDQQVTTSNSPSDQTTTQSTVHKMLKDVDWNASVELQANQLCVYSHDGIKLAGPLDFTLKKGQQIALVGDNWIWEKQFIKRPIRLFT